MITGPTSATAIVVQGVSENVAKFSIKRQTAYNWIDISNLALHGAETYSVRAYVLRRYNDPLDDTPYQNLTFNTNATAPPAVRNFEIVEISIKRKIVLVRWDEPSPPTNGKIISYTIGFMERGDKLVSSVNVTAEERCDLWPRLLCANISGDTNSFTQIGIYANNEGVVTRGDLSKSWIPRNWSAQPPEAPPMVEAVSEKFGKVSLTWSHPWKTYDRIKKFHIIIKTLSTNLTKDWITLDTSTEIDHPIVKYSRDYNCTLELNPSTSYEIGVTAITNRNVTGYTNMTEVNSTFSVYLKGNLETIPHDIDSTIGLRIPDVVNATRDTRTYILVRSQQSCKPNSVLPEHLKRDVTLDSSEAIWLAAVLPSNMKSFIVGDNKTYDGEFNCALQPKTYYKIILIVKSYDGQIANEPIIMESLPISIGEVPSSFNKSWLILIPLLAIFIVIIYLYREKAKAFFQRQDDMPLTEKLNDVNHENQSITLANVEKPSPRLASENSEPSSLGNSPVMDPRRSHLPPESEYSSMVKVKNFEDYVKQAIATGLLDKQYEMFPRGQTKPWTYGEEPQNKAKNRYKNLLAYDETRVILQKLPDDPYSDYINASYIQGFNKERAYIATQGPKQNTIIDFWRMIWQEKALVICMVANILENGKTKCEQYWPNIGKKKQFGDFLVANVKYNVFADYTFRTFQVTYQEETRKIEHLHYTSWPDHGVPLYTHGIVAFLKKLLATSPGVGPIVTHCSAGVGRTGTIILCHICLHRAAAEGVVDVLAETKKIRNQRANMVGNKQQYLMAHLVIAECLLAFTTHIPCNDSLPEGIREMKQYLRIQRQRLEDIAWQDEALQPSSLRKALPFQNWSKTRYPEEATDNYKRIYLTRYPPSDENSDYIAAIYVDGVKVQNQYIAAQLPLPSTVSDFWRMIAEFKIELIVQLQPVDPEDPTCCEIVPEDGKFHPTPYLEVNTHDIIDSEYFTTRKLLLADKSKDKEMKQQVTILSCKSWKPGRHKELPHPVALISLWQAAERIPRGDGPVVSLCHDGVTGCGLYLALSFLMERMAVERECDVCLAIRAVRRSKREFVQTIEQFEFLYDAALAYTEFFETYSNFS
ncbi:receptor-type tyrosine-protein phosphatase epsilon isoform X2 [Cephus cinctus]|uniref:protein-tyrosine-phosphatase n=1 Tax=Cephus cinctus TaxID=211228 RepID=A0AAJ7CE35_CEPCN|nr:receptor-type tyrosine-protein phosphatase epsilon isoform X2 [Cephus cinctus]